MLYYVHWTFIRTFRCEWIHFSFDCAFKSNLRQFFEPNWWIEMKFLTKNESYLLNFSFDLVVKFINHLITDFLLILTEEFVKINISLIFVCKLKKLFLLFFIWGVSIIFILLIKNLWHSGTVFDKFFYFLMTKFTMPDKFLI